MPIGILAAEADVLESLCIEWPDFGVSTGEHPHSKALIDFALGHGWLGIVVPGGGDLIVGNIPQPEAAIAAEIKLARAKPADRHSNFLQLRTPINGRLTAFEERFDPLGIELFIDGYKLLKIARRECPGHHPRGNQ